MNEIYANLVPQVLKKSRAKTVETGSPVSTEKITHEDIQTRWRYGVSAPGKHHPRKWALSERKREKIQVDQQAQIHSGGLHSNGLPNQQNRIRFFGYRDGMSRYERSTQEHQFTPNTSPEKQEKHRIVRSQPPENTPVGWHSKRPIGRQ